MLKIDSEVSSPQTKSLHGFTLIELLMVIAIIAILGSIIIGVTQKASVSAQKTIAASGLRSVGVAIQLYSQDNNGYLPGPLWSTAPAVYYTDEQTISYQLAPYLDLPEPDGQAHDFPPLSCPLFEELRPARNSPAYFMQQRVIIDDGTHNPWGYKRSDQTDDEALKSLTVTRAMMINDPETWAMVAADAFNNESPGAGWASKLLPEPLFGDERLQLYFDWHVAFVPVGN